MISRTQGKPKLTFSRSILVLLVVIGSSFAAYIQKNQLKSNERIVGGYKSKEHDKPYMVLIRFKVPYNGALVYSICGGNVLSEWWIVTAAHCKSPLFQDYTLHLGMNSWCKGSPSNIDFSDGHEQRNVNQFIQHPDYVDHLANDIALIKMDRPVTLGGNIKAVKLPTFLPQDGLMTVAGWGYDDEDNNVFECDLMEASVRVYEEEKCAPFLKGDKTHFCAGIQDGERDSCVGDSGGGLVSRSGGIYILNGLVSYGTGCGRENSPGIYTKVLHFVPWINKILSQ